MSTATAPAPAAAAAVSTPAVDFTKIPKTGKAELWKTREVHVFKNLQARTDVDSGSVVDEGRCVMFSEAIAKGEKFPAIKIMKVLDAPGKKDEEVAVCWDGMHTLRAHELAKKPEIDCLVWSGTWAQAQYLAATRANREHEKNGKPLSSKDKIHAVGIFAKAWLATGTAKSKCPSNRETADICGCSRQLVNELDPFGRGAGDKREATAAKKRADRQAKGKADGGGIGPNNPGVPYEVFNTANGNVVATYDATSSKEALERHKASHPNSNIGIMDARKVVQANTPVQTEAKNGSEKTVGFDWAGMDSHLGYLVRGGDGMKDIYNLSGDPDFNAMISGLNSFATKFNELRKKHSKKKVDKPADVPAV